VSLLLVYGFIGVFLYERCFVLISISFSFRKITKIINGSSIKNTLGTRCLRQTEPLTQTDTCCEMNQMIAGNGGTPTTTGLDRYSITIQNLIINVTSIRVYFYVFNVTSVRVDFYVKCIDIRAFNFRK